MEGKKLVAVLTMTISVLLLVFSVFFWTNSWQWFKDQAKISFSREAKAVPNLDDCVRQVQTLSYYPHKIGEKYLCKIISGDRAVELMAGFLGSAFSLSESIIYSYRGTGTEITYWITRLDIEEESKRLFNSMLHRVKEHDSFQVGDPVRMDFYYMDSLELIRDVLEVQMVKDSHNRYHYFYYKDCKVYWVTVTGSHPHEIFEVTFHYFL